MDADTHKSIGTSCRGGTVQFNRQRFTGVTVLLFKRTISTAITVILEQAIAVVITSLTSLQNVIKSVNN